MTSDRDRNTCQIDLADDPACTERLGERIGQLLQPGDTVALSGTLGAGKTTFVRGLARGLDVDDPEAVSSPTYLLVIEHDGPTPLLHADAYLPAKLEGFLEDGGLEYLFDEGKVVCVEWAENVRNHLPESVLWLELARSEVPGRKATLRVEQPAHDPRGATPMAGGFAWLQDFPTIWERD